MFIKATIQNYRCFERLRVPLKPLTVLIGPNNCGKTTAIQAIALWAAEYEREMIRARTRAAMLRHQSNGRRMSKEPPFGMAIDPIEGDRLVENPAEQTTIRIIRQLRDRGFTFRAIARHLTKKQVEHVAKLARLGLTEKERKKFQKELSAILDFVEKLKQVKTDKVEPTAQVTDLENVSRPDKGQAKSKRERKKLLDLTVSMKLDG